MSRDVFKYGRAEYAMDVENARQFGSLNASVTAS
jgi:hypothetical protein